MAVIDSGLVPGIIPDDVVVASSRSFVAGEALSDDDGHGTQMTQLVHEVAPDARILALKAVDRSGRGDPATVATAVRFATEQGAQVIALSLEGGAKNADLESALKDATRGNQAVIVMAAGNEQLDLDRFPRYPASYDTPDSLVVAAASAEGAIGGASNWGAHTVDAGAPGVDVPVHDPRGSEVMISGSSPSAALTAGTAAVVLSADPTLDAHLTVDRIRSTVTSFSGLSDTTLSGGMPDVAAAVGC